MIRDGKILCDNCQAPISRVTSAQQQDWAAMHNLCSACFVILQRRSVSTRA